MDISGPCHVLMKEGKECDLYLITTRELCQLGIKATNYFFQTNEDAERYMSYIYYVYGVEDLNNKIHSKKTAVWERKEYLDFLNSINSSEIENNVKDINFFVETTIVKRGKKK